MSTTRVNSEWFANFYSNLNSGCGCDNDCDSNSGRGYNSGCGSYDSDCNSNSDCGCNNDDFGNYGFENRNSNNCGCTDSCGNEINFSNCPCSKYINPALVLEDLEKTLGDISCDTKNALCNLEALVRDLAKCNILTREQRQLICAIEQDLFDIKSDVKCSENVIECLENLFC